MPLYKFECDKCGAQDSDTMTFAEHDVYREKYPNGRPHDWHCKGEMRQVLEFHLNLGMREHFSTQLDTYVTSDRQFNAELRRQQDEYQIRTGLEAKFEVIDPSDMKSANVNERGLEEQARAHHNEKSEGHSEVFT